MSASEGEDDLEAQIVVQNKKRKKTGGWQSFGFDDVVYRGIARKGYRAPTPIQRKCIPLLLDGKDVVGMARTGSGKTAAFLLPLLQRLKRRTAASGARALLVSPTRELALQTFKFVKELGKFTGLRAAVLVGGDSMEEQFGAMHANPDILVATPGRLLHVLVEMELRLRAVEYVVFDEADRLFEMGFAEQLADVLKRLPEGRQTLLFSATLPRSLVDFARAGLNEPTLVRLDVDTKISDQLDMSFVSCRADDKLAVFMHLLRHCVCMTSEQTIVFCATARHVDYLRDVLERSEFSCSYLYSKLDPSARIQNISKFRRRETNVLVVTDVAARGVDIPLLDNAINFHFPAKAKLFVHRVGRVARAGRVGRAFSLVSADEMPYMIDLFLFLGRPFSMASRSSAVGGSTATDDERVGVVPQEVIDGEAESLRAMHENTDELMSLRKCAANAMTSYVRSRPVASAESVRRYKRVVRPQLVDAAVHPLFAPSIDAAASDAARSALLSQLRGYKPHLTVFETNTSNKHEQYSVMKAKRAVDQKRIAGRAAAAANALALDATVSQPQPTVDAAELASAFSTVLAPSFRKSRTENSKKQKDGSDYFLPYRAKDFHSEQGLAVERDFDKTAKDAVLDMTADDAAAAYKQQSRTKTWDRKRKKFVGQESTPKKMRTEDGTLIDASYRSGRYDKWKTMHKVAANEGNETAARAFPSKRGRQRNAAGRPPRSEIKPKELILKERRRKERIQAYQTYRRNKRLGRAPVEKR